MHAYDVLWLCLRFIYINYIHFIYIHSLTLYFLSFCMCLCLIYMLGIIIFRYMLYMKTYLGICFLHDCMIFIYASWNSCIRRRFPHPMGERRPRRRIRGAFGAPNRFKCFRSVMRIPNMCLVLKLDNGKVVSIVDEQTDGQSHPVPFWCIDYFV